MYLPYSYSSQILSLHKPLPLKVRIYRNQFKISRAQFLAGHNFSLQHYFRIRSTAHSTSCPMGTKCFFQGEKWLEHEKWLISIVLRLRLCKALPPFLLYTLLTLCSGVTLPPKCLVQNFSLESAFGPFLHN